MELGEPDEAGRRKSNAIPGSDFEIPLDLVIIAVGTSANPIIQSSTTGLAADAETSAPPSMASSPAATSTPEPPR